MLKKNTIASAIISIILSIFAVVYNIITFYVFLIVGAFSSLGSNNNLWIIDFIITMTGVFFVLAIILFVISIIVISKTKKAIDFLETKRLLIFYLVFMSFIAVANIIMGILVINSVLGWLYILFGIIYVISIVLVVREIIKNSSLKLNDQNSNK